MLILSDKWITTKCQPPDLRAWVADRAAVARLGPDNPKPLLERLITHHPVRRRIGCSFGGSEVILYANPFGQIGYDEMPAACPPGLGSRPRRRCTARP